MIVTSAQVREVTESVMNELVMNEARLLESPVHEVKSPIRSLSVSTLLTAPPFIPSHVDIYSPVHRSPSDHLALELASGTTENLFRVSRSVVHFGDAQSCGVSMGSHLGILGRGAIVHQSFAV